MPASILAMDLGRTRRAVDLPEGFVPLRGEGRVDRHRLPAEDRRRPVRRRGLHHAEARRRRPLLRARRRHGAPARAAARRDAARRHRLPRRVAADGAATTSSSSARSRRRCSAAKGCSSRRCAAPARCGCSRCRSAAWPIASTRPRRRRARGRTKDQFSAGWEISWTGIERSAI